MQVFSCQPIPVSRPLHVGLNPSLTPLGHIPPPPAPTTPHHFYLQRMCQHTPPPLLHHHCPPPPRCTQVLAKDLVTVQGLVESVVGQLGSSAGGASLSGAALHDSCAAVDTLLEQHLQGLLPRVRACDAVVAGEEGHACSICWHRHRHSTQVAHGSMLPAFHPGVSCSL
jgi:hypothetical protein